MSLLALTLASATIAGPGTLAVETTYLKARPGRVADLERYIVANWFAMDALALKQGLFTRYTMSRPTKKSPDWDLVVTIGYPQTAGFDHAPTQAAWSAIKRAHREVRIDGRGLPELGTVLRTERQLVVYESP